MKLPYTEFTQSCSIFEPATVSILDNYDYAFRKSI
jgi:hypothetical protein